MDIVYTRGTILYYAGYLLKALGSSVEFLPLHLLAVDIKPRQHNIRVRHYKREESVGTSTPSGLDNPVETPHGGARLVAAGGHRPNVGVRMELLE